MAWLNGILECPLFRTSIEEAKETLITADGRFSSLADYQRELLPSLEEAIRDLKFET